MPLPETHLPTAVPLGGRYTLERELGRGAAATVYLGRDLREGRDVAVKILHADLHPHLADGRFLREIQLASRLAHPHILPVLDSGETGGQLWYTMPFVEGESFRARLERERQLPVDEVVAVARQVAEALAYAHRQGVVHRDVKPENILLAGGKALLADFGIAKPLDQRSTRITATGHMVGTPAYMSPEQIGGEAGLDGRSDQYGLACVVYEALAGEPPFGGPTPQAVLSRHLHQPAPAIRLARATVPEHLERALLRAMAKTPAERFPDMASFMAALAGDVAPTAEFPLGLRAVRRRWTWLLGAVVVGLGAWGLLRTRAAPAPAGDPLIVIAPMAHRDERLADLLRAEACLTVLYDALGPWPDLRLVNRMRVLDALQRGDRPVTVATASQFATRLGAAQFVWVDVASGLSRDSARIELLLYDTRDAEQPVFSQAAVVAVDPAALERGFRQLARLLVLHILRLPDTVNEAVLATPKLEAITAVADGWEALGEWDLPRARAAFGRATQVDPTYGMGLLWRAQVGAWLGEPVEQWRPYAIAARNLADQLGAPDGHAASALAALAVGDPATACTAYREQLRRDPNDVRGWLGLGDCLAQDDAVLRDAGGRWQFRASWHEAASAYGEAFRLAPSAHRAYRSMAAMRLARVMPVRGYVVRPGVGADSARFVAFPALASDTVAWSPRPVAALDEIAPAVVEAPARRAALVRHRARLAAIGSEWTGAFPRSADAWEARAELALDAGDGTAAATAVARAAALATAPGQRLRVVQLAVRQRLAAGDMAGAARLADSVVAAAGPAPSAEDARALAPLAMLTGQVHAAARLGRRAAADGGEVPQALLADAAALLAYAAAGVAPDSVRALDARVAAALEREVARDARPRWHAALLEQPAMFAFSATGPLAAHRRPEGWLLEAQAALVRGDSAGARRRVQEVLAVRRDDGLGPADVAGEIVLAEAEVLRAAGDLAGAEAHLTAWLDELDRVRPDLMTRVPSAAALWRAMVLQGAWHDARGDGSGATAWRRRANALLAKSDEAMQPVMDLLERPVR